MRIPQPEGKKGSLKWIQKLIELSPHSLQPETLPNIRWVSPLRIDDFAEYRDTDFLNILGISSISTRLSDFWPSRGPQWDALGTFDGGVVLVEAKAHISEFLTPGTTASSNSKIKIESAFRETQTYLKVSPKVDWTQTYYQYCNRIAHLHFLRKNGINAHLLFVSFLNDDEMQGPAQPETWTAIFQSADYALGLPKRHKLSKFIHHQYPDTDAI